MNDIDKNTTRTNCGFIDMDILNNKLVFRCSICEMKTCIVDDFENHIRDGHDNLRTDQTTDEENEDDSMEYEILEIEPASPSHFADVGGVSSSDVEKLSSEELAASEREEDANGEMDDDKYIYKKIAHGVDSKGQLYTNIEWLLPVKDVDKITLIPECTGSSYMCNGCLRSYKTDHMLSKHLSTHPNCQLICNQHAQSKTKLHQCKLCCLKFKTIDSLVYHIKLHNDSMKYTCKVCRKVFVEAECLSAHVKTVHQKDDEK